MSTTSQQENPYKPPSFRVGRLHTAFGPLWKRCVYVGGTLGIVAYLLLLLGRLYLVLWPHRDLERAIYVAITFGWPMAIVIMCASVCALLVGGLAYIGSNFRNRATPGSRAQADSSVDGQDGDVAERGSHRS